MDSVFTKLNTINVNDHTETKNGLTYLSWAWAWAEVKKLYPDATYTIYERPHIEYGSINYFTDGRTAWVKTGVTINGLEHIEMLPVMDFKNRSIPLDQVTSFDVNKTIQRSLTKACARHGLGLYIYAGEDLPEGETEDKPTARKKSIIGTEAYWKCVKAQADGFVETETGKTAQAIWVEKFRPTIDELNTFVADVEKAKNAKNK